MWGRAELQDALEGQREVLLRQYGLLCIHNAVMALPQLCLDLHVRHNFLTGVHLENLLGYT